MGLLVGRMQWFGDAGEYRSGGTGEVGSNGVPRYDCSGLLTVAARSFGCHIPDRLTTYSIEAGYGGMFTRVQRNNDFQEDDIIVWTRPYRHVVVVGPWDAKNRTWWFYGANSATNGIGWQKFGPNDGTWDTTTGSYTVYRMYCPPPWARPRSCAPGGGFVGAGLAAGISLAASGPSGRQDTGDPPSYCDSLPLASPVSLAGSVHIDPLVLDLDGDGIETTMEGRSWADGRAFFDLNADGFAERTGWVSRDDGLLAMDRNGDGIINDGAELFGNGTAMADGRRATNGLEALAELDSNGDGRIDARDAEFALLRIWQSFDEDAVSVPYELHTLAELGIQSINLTAAPGSGKDAQGNTQNRVGSFTWTDGSSGQIAEYTFQTNTAYTIATEWVDVPDDIAALPDLPGYGVVPRLQQAMARDTTGTLKSNVQSFIGATTRSEREAAMQDILYAWTGSGDILASSGHDGLSGPRVGVLSAFFGRSGAVREARWSKNHPQLR